MSKTEQEAWKMRKEIKKIISILAATAVMISAIPIQGVHAANGEESQYIAGSTILQESQNMGEVSELQTELFTEADTELQAEQDVETVLESQEEQDANELVEPQARTVYRPVSIGGTINDSITVSGEDGDRKSVV